MRNAHAANRYPSAVAPWAAVRIQARTAPAPPRWKLASPLTHGPRAVDSLSDLVPGLGAPGIGVALRGARAATSVFDPKADMSGLCG
jgi:hypothetical protein